MTQWRYEYEITPGFFPGEVKIVANQFFPDGGPWAGATNLTIPADGIEEFIAAVKAYCPACAADPEGICPDCDAKADDANAAIYESADDAAYAAKTFMEGSE